MANKQVKKNLKQQPIKQTKVKTSFIKDFFRKENFDCKTLESKLFVTAFIMFFVSLIPRLLNTSFFLPYYSIDENEVTEFAVSVMGDSKDPVWYKYGPFFQYILGYIYSIVGFFKGVGSEEYVKNIFFDSSDFYYIARLMCSIVLLITSLFIYKIGKEHFNKKVALIALILSLFPFYESLLSFQVRIDSMLAMCSTIAIWSALRYYKKGKVKYVLLAGLFAGFGLASKPLPGLLLMPTVFIAIAIRNFDFTKKFEADKLFKSYLRILIDKNIYILAIVIFIGNYIGNPYSVTNFNAFWLEQTTAIETGGNLGGGTWPKGYKLLSHFGSLGLVFIILFPIVTIIGIIKGVKEKNIPLLILASYIVVYWGLFAKGQARFYWYIAIVPLILFMVAYSINLLTEYFKNNKLKYIVILACVAVLIFTPLKNIIALDINIYSKYDGYKQSHTLIQAKEWIEKNIDKNKEILVYGVSPNMPKLVSSDIEYYIPFQKGSRSGDYFGDYFMYSRGQIEWYIQLFAKAHQEYVSANPEKIFSHIETIRYSKPIQEIINFCISNKKEILITTYKDFENSQYFKNHTIKKFENKDFINGSEVFIYKMHLTIADTINNASTYEDCSINGSILFNLGQVNQGLAYFEKAFKFKQNDEKQILFLAQKFHESKNIDKASYYYDLAVKKFPKNSKILQERALFFFNIQQFDKAINDLSAIIGLEKNNYYAYYCRGISYLNKNDQRAITDLEKAAANGYEEAGKILSQIKK